MPTRIFAVAFATLLIFPVLSAAQAPPAVPEDETIACRALEAHNDDELKVTGRVARPKTLHYSHT